jgi:hypothetical protein
MVAAVVAFVDAAAGPDQFGDKTTPMGQDPSRQEIHEDLKAWLGEDASEPG